MWNCIFRFFNGVQAVHRRVQRTWCKRRLARFEICWVRDVYGVLFCGRIESCEKTLAAFVKIADKTALDQAFRLFRHMV